jgi:hypothetical protein
MFKKVNPYMVFINDHCDGRYNEMIDRIVPFDKKIMNTNIGINETCLLQYDLFLEQKEHDEVLFQECDYFWIDKGEHLLEAVKSLPFVSPYDHPDKYDHEKSIIKYISGRHWKSTSSTTATFATKRHPFELNKDIFYKHGYLDKARWEEIGDGLYTPIPTLATHMVASQLSPGITHETFI